MQPVQGPWSPNFFSGQLARNAKEMVLGRVAARQLSVDVQDEVVVVRAAGPVTFQITGLAVIPSVEGETASARVVS